MRLFKRSKKTRKKRVVVLGLDGVPHSLLVGMMDRGIMPFIKILSQNGSLQKMEVSIPEISSVSWTTFMTGVNPGKHGIYGFMDFRPGTYEMYFPNSTDIKARTIWQDLAKRGKRSVVINLPATYPAQPIDGVLISGFVAIDIRKAVYPASYISPLEKMGYQIDLDLTNAREDPNFLFKGLINTLDTRKKAVEFIWEKENWDFFMVVITGTDRLNHFLFESYFNPSDPYHDRFLDYYQQIDQFINWLHNKYLSDCAPESTFIMLSDHGFTRLKSEVYINRLLSQNNYLNFSTESPQTIQEIGDGTLAFAMDPSRIYVNLKGKYPAGAVDEKDYNRIVNEIASLFTELSVNGKPVIRELFRKEQIYSGPYMKYAPDLLLLSHHGYDLKGLVNKHETFGKPELQGMHTQNDAFFYSNNKRIRVRNIVECKDIILDFL